MIIQAVSILLGDSRDSLTPEWRGSRLDYSAAVPLRSRAYCSAYSGLPGVVEEQKHVRDLEEAPLVAASVLGHVGVVQLLLSKLQQDETAGARALLPETIDRRVPD